MSAAAMNAFERQVLINPGYDYRDLRSDQRGAHNLAFCFILKGQLGAISWDLNTGWVKRPLVGAYNRNVGPQARRDKPGSDARLWDYSPTSGGVSSHAFFPVQEWMQGPFDCGILGGQCYGDTGYMIGDSVLEAMFDRGHEGVWDRLTEIYHEWLGAAMVNGGGDS